MTTPIPITSLPAGSYWAPAAYALLGQTGITQKMSQQAFFMVNAPGYVVGGGSAAQFTGNLNNYYQIGIQNINSGSGGSSDFVVTADVGTDTVHYADFGINNSGGGGAPFVNPFAAYLYTTDSELDFGALGSSGSINFYAGGGVSSPALIGSITPSGLNGMAVGGTTPATGKFTTLTVTSAASSLTAGNSLLGYAGSQVNGLQINGSNSGANLTSIQPAGNGDANVNLYLYSKGIGGINFYTNNNTLAGGFSGSTGIFSVSSGLANSVTLSGSNGNPSVSTTSGGVTISGASGQNYYVAGGAYGHTFQTNGNVTQLLINHTASADRYLTLTGGYSGGSSNPTIGTSGGSLSLGSTGGTTILSDATISLSGATTSAAGASSASFGTAGVVGHTTVQGWLQVTIGGVVRYLPFF